ncbi:MAG: pyridoxamine 5'-phosphate oxidase family protein [Simkaniaceae bacterium]|nr:pyridoxamine 5'-phosphate oxidase family protein [Simkaniaceae bacterium]
MKLLFFLLTTFTLFAKDAHPITTVKQWCKEEKALTEGRYFIIGTLASVSSNSMPHTQMIEVSHFDKNRGALFFTHKNTYQAKNFETNPQASLNIWLPKTRRQVTLEGRVEEVSRIEAEKSWNQMPRFMKLSFLASNHTGRLESEEAMQKRKETLDKEFFKEIPMPATFIGYRLIPEEVIFYEVNHRSFHHPLIQVFFDKKFSCK